MLNRIIVLIMISVLLIVACDSDTTTNPVQNDPIYIINITDGQTVSAPISLRAVSGTGLTFDSVDFYVDSDSVWTTSTEPYEYYWNIYQYPNNSTHELYVVGHIEDSLTTSEIVNVTVTIETGIWYISSYQPNSQQAFGVAAYQDYMFVAAGPSGLEMVDISEISTPAYLTRYESPGQGWKVAESFPYVFLADRDAGVVRAEVVSGDLLEIRDTFDTPGIAKDVAISGDYLYVADHDNLAIVDISDPDTIAPLSVFTISPSVNYVVARNDTAFVTNSTGFYIIDCTDPEAPMEVSHIITQGNAQAVAVQDTFAFVADGADGVKVYSINDPSNITYLSTFTIGTSNVSTVVVGDMILYAGTLSGELFALDYQPADGLEEIDSHIGTASIHHIYYDAPYLFAATSDNVLIFSVIE